MEFDPATTLAQADRNTRGSGGDGAPAAMTDHSTSASGLYGASSFANTLARLDGGAGTVVTSSGRAAVANIAHLFGADAHVLCDRDCAGRTTRVFSHLADRGTLAVSYVDASDPERLANAVRPTTRLLWVDSPSHARQQAFDLEALSTFADNNDLLLAVDNSALTPIFQRPIEYRADLVVYSSVRTLSGQPNASGGAVVARTGPLLDEVESVAKSQGTTAAPSRRQRLLQHVQTLSVRMQRHETNGRCVAYALDEHPAVKRVFYPGLRNQAGHETARRQQDGYGGEISFVLNSRCDVETVLRSTEIYDVDEALGGIGARIEQPASMSQADLSADQRDSAGVSDRLVRLSVGLEAAEDLIRDLEEALNAAHNTETPVSGQVRDRDLPDPVPAAA